MKIRSLFEAPDAAPSLSFEFFPPRSDDAEARLFAAVRALDRYRPSFVSITYGAGGSTRDATAQIAERMQKEHGLVTMAHLTCVGASREELRTIARDLRKRGVENIMALRGDPPRGVGEFAPLPGGLSYASQLVRLLRTEFDFSIGAACYPQKHPQSISVDDDVTRLAEKVASGADFLVTQFVFEASEYFAFVGRAREHGIRVPIIPGVVPLSDIDAVLRMASRCGASVPARIREELTRLDGEPERFARGLEMTRELCDALLRGGAPGIHIYTRNQSDIAKVLDELEWPRGSGFRALPHGAFESAPAFSA
jgi:methylenetetrahydrofolate reductase (NADPH)